ncbi:MAG: hypothetical protein ACRD8A_06220 [Candidatus Acidiferrales bacterium]
MKKNAKNNAKRGKQLTPGKKLQKTQTLKGVAPSESLSLNFTKIKMDLKPQ